MKIPEAQLTDNTAIYRAALVSVGAIYEDYEGPLTDEMVESAKRILDERERRGHRLSPQRPESS